jgi:hypothetical protein
VLTKETKQHNNRIESQIWLNSIRLSFEIVKRRGICQTIYLFIFFFRMTNYLY